jgi:myo-inositol catabolism protein IolC
MPVEKSDQPEFDFEYGEDFAAHVDEFDPTYVKVLVRYNPAGDPEVNRRQVTRLVRLSSWVSERGRRFMFELLVPPEQSQLEAVGGDFDRFDREVRPGLVLDTIRDLRSDGVDPDVWKIEGLDSRDDCRKVGDLVLSGDRRQAGCVVLGRGADAAMVDHWLKQAAGVPGFIGFAIGRTIWEKPLLDWLHGRSGRADAVAGIAANYRRNVEVYRSALGS